MAIVVDALGQEFEPSRASRVVSLVPSETETVAALGGLSLLVGRTDYCVEPEGVSSTKSVGGTKKFDVDAVVALKPDLVLANKEENSKNQIERLIAAGLRVHVSFPKTVEDNIAFLENVGRLLEKETGWYRVELLEVLAVPAPSTRVFVPIWNDPLMTFNDETYAADVLRLAGATNVYGNRSRRYPLSADLSESVAPVDTGLDDRYPRTTLEELKARKPDRVLLPDEPYAFTDEDRHGFEAALPGARVEFVDGKDLFWYGVRAAAAVRRLTAQLVS